MARPLRLDVEGGWYHLTARGNERRAIFRQAADFRHFVELLGEMEERYGLRIVAYCLMPNHYHLLARSLRPGLSRAMQWLNLSYGSWFNAAHQRSGHLFQGRFHSVLVEGEGAWAQEAGVYLHLNPVRVGALGLGKKARAAERLGALPAPTPRQIAERLEVLRSYRWSSYRAFAGLEAGPEWLAVDELRGRLGDARTYRDMVEERIRQAAPEPWESRVRWGLVFGSEEFAARLKKSTSGKQSLHREHAGRPTLRRAVELPEVVAVVERLKGEPYPVFRDRHGDTGRDLVWWAARRFAGLPLATLAEWAGGVDYTTVSAAARRLETRSRRDKLLRDQMASVRSQLSNPKI